ncbi:phosphate transport system substrate-binding protein [Thermosporothrix hazakensis]|jgi:phosphate transport system substrate-binding protein|uniref:Phosphate transport system substrate-binding protein n=2 Tax=Thermosporothrix TaxID=768650 RepID=A0A326U759_THEHA|nr:phosphate ABC transporter substrate-binding protein [Thermosporothrix hazakensis]PZW28461.1 phosphate transport system substrate-binding protein [Thermosporothrix hazakensis]BBH86347.1 phosphate-binding protein [Thermosporothrix sp. COM3]GCE45238.1 phosphate-binding protein [Thermosporothrix hazakensis]
MQLMTARKKPGKNRASLLLLLFLFLLAGCSPTGNTTELQGHIVAAGSTALRPLVELAAKEFQHKYPGVVIDVQGGGSIQGLKLVTTKQVHIGNSDIYADPALYPDPQLTDHIVCAIPFVMIVHPDIKLDSLSQQNIIDIFSTGKLNNWAQLGGPDQQIVPIVRPASSGTRATFRKYILEGRDENGTLLKTDSSDEVRDIVARTPGAIGYVAVSYLSKAVHAISIDGQKPTIETIQAGKYRFWGYEHMYTLGDENAPVRAFLDFMLTPEIQQQAQKLGYISVSALNRVQVYPKERPL